MAWRLDPEQRTGIAHHHVSSVSPEAGGHRGRRRVFALRKEEIPQLLGLQAVRHGNELRLVCYPLYGPVRIVLGDHIIDARNASLGCWVELHARYTADLSKAEIRVDRALAPFTLGVPVVHEVGRVNVSRGFCLTCGRPMDWRNTATHFCQGCLVSDVDRRDGTKPHVPP